MKKLQFSLVYFSLLVLVLGAAAQVQNGQFTGTIADPSGAAIANANVTVTNLGTNLSVTTKSNETGSYTIKELPIGTYRVSAEAKGFKTSVNNDVALNAGTSARVDFRMELGQAREVVEVTGEASAVNIEDSKLASTVTSTQIASLPLNGRNVYDLMQLAPGAVNVNGTDFEGGHGTVVNGLREDFNGFLINGVSNKGLSGGVINTPIQDTVQEFQQLQLNMSAQYGNSAGAINNLVTKSGTNSYHGSVWEYFRNDALDANQYFLNRPGINPATGGGFKPPLRFNQFGGTIGGAIIKDKLFFFGSYQGDRFKTTGTPQTVTEESPEWRAAVVAADAATGTKSVAGLLYNNFVPTLSGGTAFTLDQFVNGGNSPSGLTGYGQFLCPDNTNAAIAARFANLMGVTAADQADMTTAGCSAIPGLQTGTMNRAAPFELNSVSIFGSQVQTIGNLFNGNEGSGRIDFNPNASNRLFVEFNWLKTTDGFGPCNAACGRGFVNPSRSIFPTGSFSFVHTFTPTILNEFRVGYTQNNIGFTVGIPGVPQVGVGGALDDGSIGFGSYSGYPQFFKEHIYTYSDMVSISHGNHNIKIGADFRRNIENSIFSVARPSYEMSDPIFFAADAASEENAGVNPGICTAPCTSFNQNPQGQLESNVRHWRNLEVGAYFQDDWKVSKRLTLNLGLRYDLFTRHKEEDNLATTFLLGPGSNILDGVISANNPANCITPAQQKLAQLAGVCGPGGFAPADSLGKGDHNNIGPRVGFAWDVFGEGKTSLRGGFGLSYEGTLYNPLSNSRWNLPYYSFNSADNFLNGDVNTVIYGPTTCTATACTPSGAAPTFTGPATNPGQGVGAQATGNLTGWAAFNPNLAILTGIIPPEGVRDPYVYNYFLGIQHQLAAKWVLQVDYVGTTGHKLFRAENINRHPGSALPVGATITDNFGRSWNGNGGSGFANNNYGNLRDWENTVNSNYNSLQVQLKKQVSHGFLFNVNYTYSHAIDNGSTWHSGATTANGAAAGEGYTTDQTLPGLDRGNSLFDIRQRLVLNYVWELPGKNLHGFMGAVLGGWAYNGIWAFQSGAHWEPYISTAPKLREISNNATPCTAADVNTGNCQNLGGDYNLDRGRNDRPNSTLSSFQPSREQWANGWGADLVAATFSAPCLGCTSNLGRNTFVGPGLFTTDMTISKVFKFTERVNLKFDAAAFNVFNRANFILATTGGGAHNTITSGAFGTAAGTLNARNLQLGLKLSF
jgi:Carboxypeptidase regulatory-like domain/TonB dependent receptor